VAWSSVAWARGSPAIAEKAKARTMQIPARLPIAPETGSGTRRFDSGMITQKF
jgi:hypothetical protein